MLTLFNANLTIFDGEGAMGGGNGNDGQGIAQPATTPKKGEFDNVVFGKQPKNDAETAVGTDNGVAFRIPHCQIPLFSGLLQVGLFPVHRFRFRRP